MLCGSMRNLMFSLSPAWLAGPALNNVSYPLAITAPTFLRPPLTTSAGLAKGETVACLELDLRKVMYKLVITKLCCVGRRECSLVCSSASHQNDQGTFRIEFFPTQLAEHMLKYCRPC